MGKAIYQYTLTFYMCIWNSRKKHANAVTTGDCSVSDLRSFLLSQLDQPKLSCSLCTEYTNFVRPELSKSYNFLCTRNKHSC